MDAEIWICIFWTDSRGSLIGGASVFMRIFLSWVILCFQKLFPTQSWRFWEWQILTTRKNLKFFGFHSDPNSESSSGLSHKQGLKFFGNVYSKENLTDQNSVPDSVLRLIELLGSWKFHLGLIFGLMTKSIWLTKWLPNFSFLTSLIRW